MYCPDCRRRFNVDQFRCRFCGFTLVTDPNNMAEQERRRFENEGGSLGPGSADLPAEEETRLREIAPSFTEQERLRIVEEERLRAHLRGCPAAGVAPVRFPEATGNMVRAAVLGLILGLVGLGIGLVYTASTEPGKKVFGRQLIAWSAAGMFILFVLFLNFPSLAPTPPALSECIVCGGTGTVDCPLCVNGTVTNPVTGSPEHCSFCNGVGSKTCTFCNGTGKAQR